MGDRHIPVEDGTFIGKLGIGIHTALLYSIKGGAKAYIAIHDLSDEEWDTVLTTVVESLKDSGYHLFKVEPDFECPSYIAHGPGHQSRTKCEIRTPHPIEGEHWARDPMCPGFEWSGEKGSTGF